MESGSVSACMPLWEGLVGAPRGRLPPRQPRQPYLLANPAWGAQLERNKDEGKKKLPFLAVRPPTD